MAHGEITTYVPAELRSAVVEGAVSAAEQIFDYNLEKDQETINREVHQSIVDIQETIEGIEDIGEIPTKLSQLEDDSNHRTVTDQEKQRWNNNQGGDNIDDSDDITVITDEITNLTQLEFANKSYNIQNYSGLGKIHLKKNIETVNENSWIITSANINEEAYVDLSNGIGGTIGSIVSRFSMGYYKIPVVAGETYKITGNKADKITDASDWATRFWALSDNNNNILDCYKSNNTNLNSANIKESDVITVEQNGFLWVNFITYANGVHIIEKLYEEESSINTNVLNVNKFNTANTIYIIQYDYNLNNMVLKMPINSVLLFIGGSIHNGTIIGNNTTIFTINNSNIFGNSSILGTWKNINWYPEWFGAVGDGVVDDTIPLQKLLYLYDDIHSPVNCIMYGRTYKVTTGLYFINNTSIKGGTLVAEFENPLDWVLQTKTLYNGVQMRYMNYCDWGAHDAGYVNQTNGGTIEDLTIRGVLNKHMVIPEGGDETSEKEWDGTYCPIYGGLKIQASRTINTKNVKISNVGTAVGRAACLKTKDESGEFRGCFTGFNGYAINGHVITTSYVDANCHYKSSGESDVAPVVPYHPEYAVSAADTSFAGAFKGEYIVGTGGIDDTDDSKRMPALCCIKILHAYSMIIDNVLMDRICDVAIAGYYASITVRNAWFEGVRKCIAYGISSRMSFSVPYVNSAAVFDFIGSTINLTLDNCDGRISGIGGEDDPLNEAIPNVKNKYCLNSLSRINILNKKATNFPDDDRFTFTRIGKDLQVVAMTKAQFDTIVERDEWTLYLIMSDEANPSITKVYSNGERIMPPKPSIITFEDANVLNILSTKGYITPDENDNVSLTEVESVSSIGTSFRLNTTIQSFYEFAYFSKITKLETYTFGGCTGLNIVALPRKLESISAYILENGGTKTAVFIPKTLKNTVNFMNKATCTNLVLLAAVPPTLSATVARITNLYVPDESVSAYQNNESWATWCTNIKALSEFDIDNPSLVNVKNKVLEIYDL